MMWQIILSLALGEETRTHCMISAIRKGGDNDRCVKKADHTSLEKEQSKNKWFCDSKDEPQRRHSGGTCNPQLRSRSLVVRRSLMINQVIKECLEILCLNQTAACQETEGGWGLSPSQVLEAENLERTSFSPFCQRKISEEVLGKGGVWLVNASLMRRTIRCLPRGRVHWLLDTAWETVAMMSISVTIGPKGPDK